MSSVSDARLDHYCNESLIPRKNSHPQVKTKILERMAEWTEMFSKTADLGIMEQAYMRLKSQSKEAPLLIRPNSEILTVVLLPDPNLHPPSKPVKSQITDADRRKEEEELQMALALSIKDKASASRPTAESDSYNAEGASGGGPSASATGAYGYDPTTVLPSGKTAATVSRVRALFDFQPSEPGELQFRKGDVIAVLESVYKDWWNGSLRGQTGIFPLNYVEKLQDPTKEELEREAQMEAEVFGQIRNVEKLLALLSTSSRTGDGAVRNSEEITVRLTYTAANIQQ